MSGDSMRLEAAKRKLETISRCAEMALGYDHREQGLCLLAIAMAAAVRGRPLADVKHKLLNAVLRLQAHRDKIRALDAQREPCEGADEYYFCSRHSINVDGDHEWCDACRRNFPIVAQLKQLRRQTGGYAAAAAFWARKALRNGCGEWKGRDR